MSCLTHGYVELVSVDITVLMVVANHRFEFEKRSQLFIRTRDGTLSIVAVCVNNPDCSTFGIHG